MSPWKPDLHCYCNPHLPTFDGKINRPSNHQKQSTTISLDIIHNIYIIYIYYIISYVCQYVTTWSISIPIEPVGFDMSWVILLDQVFEDLDLDYTDLGGNISWLFPVEAQQVRVTCGYGSIPIHTIFSGMNIHLPAILMWTTGVQGFDTLPHVAGNWRWDVFFWDPNDDVYEHGDDTCDILGIFQREPNLGRDLDFFWIWEILEELFCLEANKGLETGV